MDRNLNSGEISSLSDYELKRYLSESPQGSFNYSLLKDEYEKREKGRKAHEKAEKDEDRASQARVEKVSSSNNRMTFWILIISILTLLLTILQLFIR